MDIKQMLELGQECGLRTVGEAYSNVMNHWDAFFTYENQEEEIQKFREDLVESSLLKLKGQVHDDLYYTFGNTTIEEALESLKGTIYTQAGRGY